jgi:O-antigen ligase
VLDLAAAAILLGILLQLLPLPTAVVAWISPARVAYERAATLQPELPRFLPLTLDPRVTVHAWLAAFAAAGAFWTARAIFRRGGIRATITAVAWTAVVLVLVALVDTDSRTGLVYGVWRPYDAGARPLGPFVNRNHFGTWCLLALFLCFGCLQWRRASRAPPRGWSWRARLAHALDGRSLVLALAAVLLAVAAAFSGSRSTMVALACGAGYVAAVAPPHARTRRGPLRAVALTAAVSIAVLAYTDVDRWLSRVDETRLLGLSRRAAIWRDAATTAAEFPVAGVGAGGFSRAMRLYQTGDRTYFWNEPHNQYLQAAAEGGMILAIPALCLVVALAVLAARALRRPHDPLRWLRLGASAALVAAAVQAIWETGLGLPANGMLAAVAAAVVLHTRERPLQPYSNSPADPIPDAPARS